MEVTACPVRSAILCFVANSTPIYESGAEMRPDSEFVPASLDLLVVGNRGRLLDTRRTPVTVVGVEPERAAFVARVEAFEDAGATWELFLGELGRFQFERDSARADTEQLSALEHRLAEFDRPLVIECVRELRDDAMRELDRRRVSIRSRLGSRLEFGPEDVERAIETRNGDPRFYALTAELLAANGLAALEEDLLGPLVSNPRSGEAVKGHAIVLAELGLCPYRGRVVRDPDLFAGDGSKENRAEHLLWRMALTQELWRQIDHVLLYRGAATDSTLDLSKPASFVSATFSQNVAESHFEGGPATKAAVLIRSPLPLDRLFMSFVETELMNSRFKEAEALLIGGDPSEGI